MKKMLLLSVILALVISTFAQSPQKMNYQCVIRNSSGALVTNHAVGLKVSILQGSASGTVVYAEVYNPKPQTNANGLVTVEIGTGVPVTGTFSAINWSGGPFFLKTEADPAGETDYTITGTSQLLSVPYALYAKNAESYTETDPVFGASAAKSINSGSITNWNTAYSWGNHAGLYRPISYVPAWSEITAKPVFASVATSGSYNDLLNKPVIINSQWTTSGNNIYYNTGRVGIGRTDPGTLLHVHSNITYGTGITTIIRISDNYKFWNIGLGNIGDRFSIASEDNTERFTIHKSTGFVGIGTTDPHAPLEVNGQIKITGGGPGAGKVLTSDSEGLGYWLVPPTGPWVINGSDIYYNVGNVGIGVTSPVNPLVINGGASTYIRCFNSTSGMTQSDGLFFGLSESNHAWFWNNEGGDMLFGTSDHKWMTIKPNGYIGIGTDLPSEKLEVSGNIQLTAGTDRFIVLPDKTKSIFIGGKPGYQSSYAIFFITDNGSNVGVERLAIKSDKVGIGTVSPSQTLDVNGNARFRSVGSGAYSSNLNITSDGTLTTATSDARLKENVRPLQNSLDKVMQLNGVSFTWKENPEYGTHIGFVAQEFEEVLPELVFTNKTDGYKGINYSEVSAVLVEAIKELKAENDQLKARLDEIEKHITLRDKK